MANKFTVTLNATITTDDEASTMMDKVLTAIKTVGSNCIVQQFNSNQWVDQVNSKPQVFNSYGTEYVEEQKITEITTTQLT